MAFKEFWHYENSLISLGLSTKPNIQQILAQFLYQFNSILSQFFCHSYAY